MTDPKVTTWTSGGDPFEVRTWRANGQSDEAWCAQHSDAVDAAQLLWPPDA